MTPPPTITTRARTGRSVIPQHLVDEPAQQGAAEGAVRLVEAVHPPGPKVEVERAGRRLDEPPQRPAVLAAQGLQAHSREQATRAPAEVGLGVGGRLVRGELALGGG